jgi:hypothetical protein
MSARKKEPGKYDFKPEYYLRVYRLARAGVKKRTIVRDIGVPRWLFDRWLRKYPALQQALDEARKDLAGRDERTFERYVYNRLPEDLKDLWKRLVLDDGAINADLTVESLDRIFRGKPLLWRKRLFLHALIHFNFCASEACRCVGLNRATVEGWCRDDRDFARLYKEMHWHKKNFFESALVDLVARGDPGAIVFANRTLNKDRGYADRQEVRVTGEVAVTHRFDDLGLGVEEKKKILAAIRTKKTLALEDHSKDREVIDADFEVREPAVDRGKPPSNNGRGRPTTK